MRINIGKTDKYLRLLAGILIILAGIALQSWWGLLGMVLVITALISWCPLYGLFNINTCTK